MPIVAALGASGTLLASALATIALGLITVAVLVRARTATGRPGTTRNPDITRNPGTTRKPGTSG